MIYIITYDNDADFHNNIREYGQGDTPDQAYKELKSRIEEYHNSDHLIDPQYLQIWEARASKLKPVFFVSFEVRE